MSTTERALRTWLVGGGACAEEPADRPVVRDDQMRQWAPGGDGHYHWRNHHMTWTELRVRFDLVEVG